MPKVCFILVAGLSRSVASRLASSDHLLSGFAHSAPLRPVWPAVTCTMQATLTTGVLPEGHGIISNGLYTYNHPEIHPFLDADSFPEFRKQISFWEQSTALLQRCASGRDWACAPRYCSGNNPCPTPPT